jgi:hypothetical protein
MRIKRIVDYIKLVNMISSKWVIKSLPWFRGEYIEKGKKYPNGKLIPKIYYKEYSGKENQFVQSFRNYAYAYGEVPEFSRIDQWLFLMRHCELPTRLLDWTESALFALYFAINDIKKNEYPIVWMINPLFLNMLTYHEFTFELTWKGYKNPTPVPIRNICAAFTGDKEETQEKYPVAIYPQPVHQRISSQRGVFTVHGYIKKGLDKIFEELNIKCSLLELDDNKIKETVIKRFGQKNISKFKKDVENQFNKGQYLCRIEIGMDYKDKDDWLLELRQLGISQAVLFPDLDGLAREIKTVVRSNIF